VKHCSQHTVAPLAGCQLCEVRLLTKELKLARELLSEQTRLTAVFQWALEQIVKVERGEFLPVRYFAQGVLRLQDDNPNMLAVMKAEVQCPHCKRAL
jgi:hypothetical protein